MRPELARANSLDLFEEPKGAKDLANIGSQKFPHAVVEHARSLLECPPHLALHDVDSTDSFFKNPPLIHCATPVGGVTPF